MFVTVDSIQPPRRLTSIVDRPSSTTTAGLTSGPRNTGQLTPHVHGDLCEVVDASQLLSTDQGTFKDHVEQSRSMTMKRHQFCFSHGMECETRRSGDVEFSGLPCEENSRCNAKRKFMEGRFKRLYSTWARRHTILETPLIVLENTEEPWIDSNFVFISI